MTSPEARDTIDKLVDAYDKMLERVGSVLEKAEKSAIPSLRRSIDHAREKAVELGELTREEADKVSKYVERDMEDAADYLTRTGEELRQWFRFDLDLIESRMRDMFASVADQTSLQLKEFAERARRASQYHTGEITGPGTLKCEKCGKEVHFHHTGHIPPCSQCSGTEFRRVESDEDVSDV